MAEDLGTISTETPVIEETTPETTPEPIVEEVVVPEEGAEVEIPSTLEDLEKIEAAEAKEETTPEPEPEVKQEEENTEFNPDELEFEEEEIPEAEKFTFSGYDLSKYADALDFEGEESRKVITEKAAALEKAGYSQEKAEGYIDALIEQYKNNEVKVETAEDVKSKLNEKLDRESKANYRAIGSWLKDNVKGTEFEGEDYKAIMSNPKLVKLMNNLYKQSISKNGVVTKEEVKVAPKIKMDYVSAMGSINDKIMADATNEEIQTYAKSLLNSLSGEDLQNFKESIKNTLQMSI